MLRIFFMAKVGGRNKKNGPAARIGQSLSQQGAVQHSGFLCISKSGLNDRHIIPAKLVPACLKRGAGIQSSAGTPGFPLSWEWRTIATAAKR
jgi:hypothetical protein